MGSIDVEYNPPVCLQPLNGICLVTHILYEMNFFYMLELSAELLIIVVHRFNIHPLLVFKFCMIINLTFLYYLNGIYWYQLLYEEPYFL